MNDLISRQAAIAEAYDVVIDGNVFKVVQVETLYGLPTIDPAENGGCWGCCCEKLGQVKHGKYSPEEFADKMNRLREEAIRDDYEFPHIEADGMMCELLSSLGYEEGAKIFDDMPKLYS